MDFLGAESASWSRKRAATSPAVPTCVRAALRVSIAFGRPGAPVSDERAYRVLRRRLGGGLLPGLLSISGLGLGRVPQSYSVGRLLLRPFQAMGVRVEGFVATWRGTRS
jgi:hypothetical protein